MQRMSIEPIDPDRGIMERGAIRRFSERFERGPISCDQIGILGPQFLDWKVRPEQAAIGAEYLDRFFYNRGDVPRFVLVDEGAEG